MATGVEITYKLAVAKADSTRQAAKAAAFATYGFSPSGLATYIAALAAADVAYLNSVNAAANTANAVGLSVPSGQAANASCVSPGGLAGGVQALGGVQAATMGGIC